MENTGASATRLFVGTTELDSMLDAAARELYDRLVKAIGHERYSLTGSITTVRGQTTYDLPDDFYQLLSVRANYSGLWQELDPYAPSQIAELRNGASYGSGCPPLYRLTGIYGSNINPTFKDQIRLEPAPSAVFTVELDYIPTFIVMTSGTEYSGVNGWEDYIVFSVVADVLAKEESENGYWVAKKNEVGARIDALASRRDRSKPAYVVCREPPGGRLRGLWGSGRRWP